MRAISIIFKRELGAYLQSPVGWVVASLALFLQGILFQAFAMGGLKKMSFDVVKDFFYFSSGTTMGAAVLLSMRLVSEERQQGTMVLLNTSPVRDSEIVMGKYLAALAFLAGILLVSIYMPLLVLVRGKVSFAHLAVGYTGLLLLGSAALAIGTFASSLARHQLVAGAVGAVIVVAMLFLWALAKVVDPPVKDVLGALDLFSRHFPPFQRGIIHLRDICYYLAVSYFFLLLAVKTMEAKRWE